MKEIMFALMTFASPLVGLPVPDRLPQIKNVEYCELQKIVYADPARECDRENGAMAAYGPGVIFLSEQFDPRSLRSLAILLHELVHHMQHENGVELGSGQCGMATHEKPAWEATFAFLRGAGVDPYEITNTNALSILMITTCMEVY